MTDEKSELSATADAVDLIGARIRSGQAAPGDIERAKHTLSIANKIAADCRTATARYRADIQSLNKGSRINPAVADDDVVKSINEITTAAEHLAKACADLLAEPTNLPGRGYEGVPVHLVGRAITPSTKTEGSA